jgi:hypothetical protein
MNTFEESVLEAERQAAQGDAMPLVLEAEMPVMPEEQQLGAVRNFLTDRKNYWDNRALDERGKFSPLDFIPGRSAVKAAGKSGNMLRRHKLPAGVAALSAIALLSSLWEGPSLSADADLNAAHTSANIHKIVWDKDTAISPGTVYFQEQVTAQNVEYKFTLHACLGKLICHDFHSPGFVNPHVNKQFDGDGQEVVKVPLAAITAYNNGDKIDVDVNLSQVEGDISWSGAGPIPQNFTGDPSNPNFGDQHGARDQFLKAAAALQAGVQINGLENTYDQVDDAVDHDLLLKGLDAMGTCNKETEFLQEAEKQIEDSVRKTIGAIPETPDIAHVRFTHKASGIKVDTGQNAETALNSDSEQGTYSLDGGKPFQLDYLKCDVGQQKVIQ